MPKEPLTPEQRALVQEFWSLAKNMAIEYAKEHGQPFADYESHAGEALCELARSYDPDKGAFTTYLYHALRTRIIDQIRRQTGGRGRMPSTAIRRAINGAYPASHLAETNNSKSMAGEARGDMLMLDLMCGGEEDEGYAEVEAQEALSQIFARLGPRDRKIMHLRMQGMSLEAIGRELGVTESRICQIIGKLRPRIEAAMREGVVG